MPGKFDFQNGDRNGCHNTKCRKQARKETTRSTSFQPFFAQKFELVSVSSEIIDNMQVIM